MKTLSRSITTFYKYDTHLCFASAFSLFGVFTSVYHVAARWGSQPHQAVLFPFHRWRNRPGEDRHQGLEGSWNRRPATQMAPSSTSPGSSTPGCQLHEYNSYWLPKWKQLAEERIEGKKFTPKLISKENLFYNKSLSTPSINAVLSECS